MIQPRRQIRALRQGVQAGQDAEQVALNGGLQQIGAVRKARNQIHHIHQKRRRRQGNGAVGPAGVSQGAGAGLALQFRQRGSHRIGVGDRG